MIYYTPLVPHLPGLNYLQLTNDSRIDCESTRNSSTEPSLICCRVFSSISRPWTYLAVNDMPFIVMVSYSSAPLLKVSFLMPRDSSMIRTCLPSCAQPSLVVLNSPGRHLRTERLTSPLPTVLLFVFGPKTIKATITNTKKIANTTHSQVSIKGAS